MVEMITTMSIVAILMAIGVPSYRYVTSANRMSSDINGLLGDLQFARAEAIKEGQMVSVCSSTNGTSCAGTASWKSGWLVFSDSVLPIGTINPPGDVILRAQPAFANQEALDADSAVSVITFNREGFASLPGPITLTLHDAATGWNAKYTRCLSLTIVGAMSTQRAGEATAESAPAPSATCT